jgi:adenylate cyclase
VSWEVELGSIRQCLQPGVPAPLATCGADGTPHINYIQQVQYVDPERVGTSRQVFNRALEPLPAGHYSQALIVCIATGEQYRLDLQYLHTDSHGEAFETMRASLDAIGTDMQLGPTFRLRGLDVHRVLRCTHVLRERPSRALAADQLASLDALSRRLERCATYEETGQELLDALDDIFGIPYALVFTTDGTGRLLATSGSGPARSVVGSRQEMGVGLVGTAARHRRPIVNANLQRARALGGHHDGNRQIDVGLESPIPGLADASNAAAVPLIVGEELLGVLYLESTVPGAFSGSAERLLHIIGAHAAAALAARARPMARSSAGPHRDPERSGQPALQLVYYQADDTVLCDSAYIVKGAPGRILWAMLTSHVDSGRTHFTNRELRLDESLGLPAGNDNLEARLLVLRRRLASIGCGVTLERLGRGRLELRLERPAELTVVPTAGPMRGASRLESQEPTPR